MILERQLPEGPSDLLRGCLWRDPQDFIVVVKARRFHLEESSEFDVKLVEGGFALRQNQYVLCDMLMVGN